MNSRESNRKNNKKPLISCHACIISMFRVDINFNECFLSSNVFSSIYTSHIQFDASKSSAIILAWSVGSSWPVSPDPAAGVDSGCLPLIRFWGAGFGVPLGGDSGATGAAGLLLAAATLLGAAFAFLLACLSSASDALENIQSKVSKDRRSMPKL